MNTPNEPQHRCHSTNHAERPKRNRHQRDITPNRHTRDDSCERDFTSRSSNRRDFASRDFAHHAHAHGHRAFGPRAASQDIAPRDSDRRRRSNRRDFASRDSGSRATSDDFRPRDRNRRGYDHRTASYDFTPRDLGRRSNNRRSSDPRDPNSTRRSTPRTFNRPQVTDFAPRHHTHGDSGGPTCSHHDHPHNHPEHSERRTTHRGRRRADRRANRTPRDPGSPTPEQRTTRAALTSAERALRKLTHTYLQAVSTPDPTCRDQARTILTNVRQDLHTILTPEA